MPYKRVMEEKAEECELEKKAVLDFFAAYRSITGFDLDDPESDKQYLEAYGEGLLIGIKALLAPKAAMEQIDQLERIFLWLIDEA